MKPKSSTAMYVSAAVLAIYGSNAGAQTDIFRDTFNRTDSRNIQASLTGITDNTGSSLAVGSVYSQPWLDPNNQSPTFGVQDGAASNGGGAQIINNTLQLATGAGTSDAYINHNFINSSILTAGGFSVSFDLTAYAGTAQGQGGAFAIGMSASDAASAGDAFGDTSPSMTRAFHDANSAIGADISTVGLQPVVSDFWVALRGNGSLIWGGSSGNIAGVTGLTKTGKVSANFSVTDFNAGSTVTYEIFYNGISEGTGSFLWSGTDENYIGFDARDGTGVNFDNIAISTVPEPSIGGFALIGFAGLLFRRRNL